jgi:hypothetical protein
LQRETKNQFFTTILEFTNNESTSRINNKIGEIWAKSFYPIRISGKADILMKDDQMESHLCHKKCSKIFLGAYKIISKIKLVDDRIKDGKFK